MLNNSLKIFYFILINIFFYFVLSTYFSKMNISKIENTIFTIKKNVEKKSYKLPIVKNDTDNIRTLANSIITNYESSTYSVFSKLMLAKIESESGNLENAEIHLNSILDNNLRDEFKHIARLRLIRVLIANNKLESAEKILSKIKSNKFFSHYEELRGDILVKKDRIKEAEQAYKNALTASEKTEEAQLILQMKLDDLGKI